MVASREYCTQERYTPSRIPSFAFQPTLRRPQCDVTALPRADRHARGLYPSQRARCACAELANSKRESSHIWTVRSRRQHLEESLITLSIPPLKIAY